MTRPIDDAHEKLLREGRRRLQEQGCETLGVKSLTDACGMATGTFYSYFANKSEFIFAVLGIDWDDVIATAETLVDAPLPLRDKLKGVFEILNTFEHTYWKVFWQLPTTDEAGRRYRDTQLSRMYGCVAKIIDHGMADGSIEGIPIPLEKYSRLIVHELVSLAVHDDITFDEFFDCLLLQPKEMTTADSGDGGSIDRDTRMRAE